VIPAEIRPQLDTAVGGLRRILGDDLAGVYLHGSAVLGAFGPLSDIDVFAVVQQPLEPSTRRQLVELLLAESGPYESTGGMRAVELDVVLTSALRDWHHPAPLEFHYTESLRRRFEAGELEPWESLTNRDIAAHVRVLRHAGLALVGAMPEELFPDVPEADFRDALLYDVEWSREHISELGATPGGIRNAVLSLARVWAAFDTGAPQSKASGAEWALPRLPAELRPVLEHADAAYRGSAAERWESLPLGDYAAFVATKIDALTQR
jgi:streptomycin 3"-adenylyltransferase